MGKDYVDLPIREICATQQPIRWVTVEKTLLDPICDQLGAGSDDRERGGLLGLSADNHFIVNFFLDKAAEATACSYKPSEAVLRYFDHCPSSEICFGGIIHTHKQMKELSRGDFEYIKAFFEANPKLKRMISGVFTIADRKMHLYSFERALFLVWYQTDLPAYLRRISDACQLAKLEFQQT